MPTQKLDELLRRLDDEVHRGSRSQTPYGTLPVDATTSVDMLCIGSFNSDGHSTKLWQEPECMLQGVPDRQGLRGYMYFEEVSMLSTKRMRLRCVGTVER